MSRVNLPWQPLRLFGAAVIGLALGGLYTLRFNPEIRFFRRDYQLKEEWTTKLQAAGKPKFVVVGGSGMGTTLDGRRMLEQHQLRVLNLALAAGMGAKVLVHYGLPSLQSGDTLVVAIEPALLTKPVKTEALGVQFCIATGQLGLLASDESTHWLSAMLQLRPGAYHFFNRLGKLALRQPSYRYPMSELHESGWQAVEISRDFPDPALTSLELSPEAKSLLGSIRDYGAARNVRVWYSMPQMYCAPASAPAFRQANLRFLSQISEFMPVVPDPEMGIHPVRLDYADTEFHFTAVAATRRTDALAARFAAGKPWTREVLGRRLQEGRWEGE